MDFIAHIDIMPHEELLDPQGKAVLKNLKNIDVTAASDVRIGKHIVMELSAENEDKAKEIVEHACKNLLANIIMEQYTYRIEEK
jgi:phosphoribosylformylglycinamidine synthase